MRRIALLLLFSVACGKGAASGDDDPGLAKVRADGAAVKRGPIGDSGDAQLSYVLVDVENASDKDRLISLQGKLMDGQTVAATLGTDELRVPAHEVRTFALVADGVAGPGARADLQVVHATALDYPPPVELGKREDRKGDLFVAVASAKNTVPDRAASAVVACTFYGADGRILARPFTVVELAGGGEGGLRFEGPSSAARAVMFVGQVAYKQ